MTRDARFEDAREAPLRLKALEPDDLSVVSSLVQDAVFPITEMTWRRRERRFAVLLNRFRWEDAQAERRGNRDYERVQALLVIDEVLKVASQGIDRGDSDLVLSLLSVNFEPADAPGRKEILTFAGDGAIACDVEALDVTLKDVTRPYVAPSKSAPRHPD